jgi:hypothetical protein
LRNFKSYLNHGAIGRAGSLNMTESTFINDTLTNLRFHRQAKITVHSMLFAHPVPVDRMKISQFAKEVDVCFPNPLAGVAQMVQMVQIVQTVSMQFRGLPRSESSSCWAISRNPASQHSIELSSWAFRGSSGEGGHRPWNLMGNRPAADKSHAERNSTARGGPESLKYLILQ